MTFLANEIWDNKYGTFLGNCERDRVALKLSEKTESIWTHIMLEKERFTNRLYNRRNTQHVIKCIPITSPFCMDEWRELFYKWSEYGYNQNDQNLTQYQYEALALEPLRFYILKNRKEELI